ncbi:MAG TPA: MaoC/PaaZ C-terminal domain-containing protein [Solirubrobacteraceae bacterium]
MLSGSPNMLRLFARAGAATIPGVSRLPFLGSGGGGNGLPELTLVLEGVSAERDRLANYDRVCKFPLRDELPATYPHMLAFPLQLELMTDQSFPFPALGLVHIANRIVQHRPIRIGEPLALRVWAADLTDDPRGRRFSLRSEARVDDALVWEEDSTILKRDGGSQGGGRRPARQDQPELPVTATWRLPGDLGRRYASVSGDMNPIHMHQLSARLFGFPTAIAHGMWTKARCLAALDPRLPDSFAVEVEFKKPILLPATVEFAELDDAAGIGFAVRGAGKGTPHLDGRVSFG